MNSLHVYLPPSFTCHIAARDAEVDLLIRTGLHNEGQEIGVPLTGPGLYRLQINGGNAFMIEPHMIYCCHKCAFSDIAELRGIYIPNELSIKKSLKNVRVWTVVKTGLVSVGDEMHLLKDPFISSYHFTIGKTGLLSYCSKFRRISVQQYSTKSLAAVF